MDIAAMSTMLAMGNVQGNASVAVASKIKELAEQNGANLIELMKSTQVMEQSVSPHLGGNIDIKL